MPKINTYELLKILVWFLSLSNIFREQHEHFLGPFGAIFIWVIFRNDSEGFTNPHFRIKWNLNMMHTWLASLGHTRTRDVTDRGEGDRESEREGLRAVRSRVKMENAYISQRYKISTCRRETSCISEWREYYIICFGCFICINMLFYIIFVTNLLTESIVPVSVLFFLF